MGHDHIRFVLMVAFFFSTCLIASSGSEMEIIRFSGTYTLTHSERAVQVTESIRRSEGTGKVTKVASLAPKKEREGGSKRSRTAQEFEMRQKSRSCKEIEKKQQTFIPVRTSAMTQGTTGDQQDLSSSSHPQCPTDISIDSGHCTTRNHGSSQEFTATYSDSDSSSSFLVCQKVPFLQINSSKWTIEGKRRKESKESKEGKKHRHPQQVETIPLDHDDDGPYKPIFFVYPPQRPSRLGRKKKVGNDDDDDGMDYYQPTFHLDFESSASSEEGRDACCSEYDPRIRGGFDSYGEDVSFYLSSSPIVESGRKSDTSKEGRAGVGNASSYYDELCKALLGTSR